MNMDVPKVGIEYKKFTVILGGEEILSKILRRFYENLGRFSFFRRFYEILGGVTTLIVMITMIMIVLIIMVMTIVIIIVIMIKIMMITIIVMLMIVMVIRQQCILTELEITACHYSNSTQKCSMNRTNILPLMDHILNLTTCLDYVLLFHE